MSKKEKLQKEFNYLEDVIKRIDEFDKVEINNEVRVKISNLLHEIVNEGKFIRRDEDKKVILGIPNWDDEMIQIYVRNNKVQTYVWPVFKLMQNYKEQIEEIEAYEYKYRNM